MKSIKVNFKTIVSINDFVRIASKLDANLDLVSDRKTVDAKSIMGILSMNLTRPLELQIISDHEEEDAEAFTKFVCEA
jgi:phosphotransferase system HPr-like phosphotransfer protein